MGTSKVSFDPGRTFVIVRHGPYTGRYEVFKTTEDFRRFYPDEPVVAPWWNGRRGDWVLCDDGRVCQIIRRYTLGDASKRRSLTECYRVPWTTAYYYLRKDGTHVGRLVFERKTSNSASSLSKQGTYRHGKHMNSKKLRFAYLVLKNGMAPYQAYMAAFSIVNIRSAKILSNHLMKDDKLMREITQIYKEIFDAEGLSQTDIVKKVKEILDKEKGKTQLDALRLVLELRGEISTSSKLKVEFPQLPAPPAPESHEALPPVSVPALPSGGAAKDASFTVIEESDEAVSNQNAA